MRTYERARWEEICGSAQAVAGGVVSGCNHDRVRQSQSNRMEKMPKIPAGNVDGFKPTE